MRRIFGLAGITMFLSLTLVLSTYAADESLTITTYYPTPQGSFNDLNVSGNLTVGGTVGIGTTDPGTATLAILSDVGIGTTNPTSKLVIYDDGEGAQTRFTQDLTYAGFQISTDYTSNAYTPGIFWSTLNNNPTLPKAGIYLQETGSGTFMHFGTSNNYATGITNDAMVIDYAGRVGFGIAGPQAKLHINTYGLGDTDDAFKMGGEGEFIIDATGVTGGRLSILKSGYVGINTASPSCLLNVNVGNPATDTMGIKIGGPNNYNSLFMGIKGTPDYDAYIGTYGNDLHIHSGHWLTSGATASEDHEIYFYTSRNGSTDWESPKMVLDSDGNVGIGTASPAAKLDIRNSGDTTLTLENIDGDITSTDVLGTIYFKGYESGDSTHRTGAVIRAKAWGGWGDTNGEYDAPTALSFLVQNNAGSGFPSRGLVIKDSSNLGASGTNIKVVIGDQSDPYDEYDGASAALKINSDDGALVVPRLTTTQRNGLFAINGMIIYNTTTNQFNFYENNSWVTK